MKKFTNNDLPLLVKISNNPDFEKLLFDRQQMIKELQPILKIAPSLRKKGDVYNERPSLENLPSIQLFRLYLLKKALENKDFLQTVAKTGLQDYEDTKTEYSGIITLNQNNELFMKNIKTIKSGSDGTSILAYDPCFSGGALVFHYHALKDNDNYNYSGPSGSADGVGGDIPSARITGNTGMVITLIRQNDKEIEFNFDLYWVDNSDPKNPQAYVFDMGNRIIPK